MGISVDDNLNNIILITVDSLRADHLSIYGYKRKTSPFIDRLAKKGVLFTRALTNAPYTTASINSMLTSRYPIMGAETYTNINRGKTLPEFLRENGFYTIGVHSNPWFWFYNFGKGFNIFLDPYNNHQKSDFIRKAISFTMRKILRKIKPPYATAKELNEALIKILLQNRTDKLFIWVHYMDVHEPYLPVKWQFTRKRIAYTSILDLMSKKNKYPEKITTDEKKFLLSIYDDKIWELDKEIEHLTSVLGDLIDLEKTLIIFTADHGEAFGERGMYGHCANNNLNLHQELLHIPMIFWSANKEILSKLYEFKGDSGKISRIFSLMDVGPTLLHLLGLPIPPSFLGKSIFNNGGYVISQGVVAPDPNVKEYVTKNEKAHAITIENYRLIYWEQENYLELYDLAQDPFESQNIADKNKDITNDLKEKLLNEIYRTLSVWGSHEALKLKKTVKNLKLKGKI